MPGETKESGNEKTPDELRAEALAASRLRKERDIYSNFATPLMGQYLNLPHDPIELTCPACGVRELSHVENNMKWWAIEFNRIFGCLFVTLCCCCCFDYKIPCKQTDRNHYCKNCGCYFGRTMKRKQIRPSKK